METPLMTTRDKDDATATPLYNDASALARNIRSRMDGFIGSTTTGSGRRVNQKAYAFFFVLIFTATLSIYRAANTSTVGMGGELLNQNPEDHAPLRLEKSALTSDFTATTETDKVAPSTRPPQSDTVAASAVPVESDKNESPVQKRKSDTPAQKSEEDNKPEANDDKKESNRVEKADKENTQEATPDKYIASETKAGNEATPEKKADNKEEVPETKADNKGTDSNQANNKGDASTEEPVATNEKPMNIVILYADDWRHDSLGSAGRWPVETPFLDWLAAKQGIRFTHNCVTTSVCWISRATLHTGQYFSRHQALRPKDNGWYANWTNTYPALLKEKGYWVSHIGKWHTHDWGKIKHTYDHEKIYYGKHWFPGNPRPIHVTERNENDALDTLKRRPKDKPFVLTVAFFAPHSWDNNPEQFLPQNKSMALYQNITLEAPVDMDASFKRLPKGVITERNEGRHRWRQRFDEPTKYDKMLKNYFRLISEVDGACESVWKELEAQGILNETLVIFSTDNGFYHGEHGLAGKWYPHEESIRVPLIVYDPRMPENKRGTTDDSFTLNIDLAPTILGAANVKQPNSYQGRDISDLYLQERTSPPWREEFFYEHPVHINQNVIPASSALVRKDIKYIVWPNWSIEQLFNLTSDPMEEEDLILNPDYAGIHGELKARHDALRDLVAQENTRL